MEIKNQLKKKVNVCITANFQGDKAKTIIVEENLEYKQFEELLTILENFGNSKNNSIYCG